MVLRPQAHLLAIGLSLPTHAQVALVGAFKGVTQGLEFKAANGSVGMATHKVYQEGCNQRAMNNQAGVALDLRHILAVVVNAVTIEGEC